MRNTRKEQESPQLSIVNINDAIEMTKLGVSSGKEFTWLICTCMSVCVVLCAAASVSTSLLREGEDVLVADILCE